MRSIASLLLLATAFLCGPSVVSASSVPVSNRGSKDPISVSSSHVDEFGFRHEYSYTVTPFEHVYHLSPKHNLHSVHCEFDATESENNENEIEFESNEGRKMRKRAVSTMKIHLKDSRRSLFHKLERELEEAEAELEEAEAEAEGEEEDPLASMPDVLPVGTVLVFQDVEHSCHQKHNEFVNHHHRHHNSSTSLSPLFVRLLHPFAVSPSDEGKPHVNLRTESGNWKDCFSKGEINFHTENINTYQHHHQQQQLREQQQQQNDEEGEFRQFNTLATKPPAKAAPSTGGKIPVLKAVSATANNNAPAADLTQTATQNFGWNMDKKTLTIATNGAVALTCVNCFMGFQLQIALNAKWDTSNPSINNAGVTASATVGAGLGFGISAGNGGPLLSINQQITPTFTVVPTFPLVVIAGVPVTVSIQIAASVSGSVTVGAAISSNLQYGFKYTFTRGTNYQGKGQPAPFGDSSQDGFSPVANPPSIKTTAGANFNLGVTGTVTLVLDMFATLALNVNPHLAADVTVGSGTGCPNPTDIHVGLKAGVGTNIAAGFQVSIPFFKSWSVSKAVLSFPVVPDQSIYSQCASPSLQKTLQSNKAAPAKAPAKKRAEAEVEDADRNDWDREEKVQPEESTQEDEVLDELREERELIEEVKAEIEELRQQIRNRHHSRSRRDF